MAPSLVTLPPELLLEVLRHLHCLKELHSLLLTCKHLHCFCNETPKKIVTALALRTIKLRLHPSMAYYSQYYLAYALLPIRNICPTERDKRREDPVEDSPLREHLQLFVDMYSNKTPIGLDDLRKMSRKKQNVLDRICSIYLPSRD
jgi:hypothetical protein